jgi:hypothetical protein
LGLADPSPLTLESVTPGMSAAAGSARARNTDAQYNRPRFPNTMHAKYRAGAKSRRLFLQFFLNR